MFFKLQQNIKLLNDLDLFLKFPIENSFSCKPLAQCFTVSWTHTFFCLFVYQTSLSTCSCCLLKVEQVMTFTYMRCLEQYNLCRRKNNTFEEWIQVCSNQARQRRNFDKQLCLWQMSAESSIHYRKFHMKFRTGSTVFVNVCRQSKMRRKLRTLTLFTKCICFIFWPFHYIHWISKANKQPQNSLSIIIFFPFICSRGDSLTKTWTCIFLAFTKRSDVLEEVTQWNFVSFRFRAGCDEDWGGSKRWNLRLRC